jgi:DNA-binding response OmpR family regulator
MRNSILVVDDDAGVREVLANLLRRSGYRVSCANNGEAGWEALCANSFDALITDHAMPRLTGLDLLRRVRSGPLKLLPVILISGKMPWDEADLLELAWPGMAMEKPFSFFELLTSVRTVLTMTTRAASVHDGQTSSVFDHKLPPPPIAIWQDDGRTRLPMRKLVRVS